MSGRELFGVGVRLFGVWMLIRCVEYLSAAFALNFLFRSETADSSPRGMMSYAAAALGVGTFLLLGTRRLVEWTYGADGVAEPRRKAPDRDDLV